MLVWGCSAALRLELADHPGYPWSRTDIEQMITGPDRAMFELIPTRKRVRLAVSWLRAWRRHGRLR